MVPMHTPPWQASSPVQTLPSSQGVASVTAIPMHTPLWQVSPLVQALPSSHGARSGSGQRAGPVQVRVSPRAAAQVVTVPPLQPPPWQVSVAVQASPSSQPVPVSGVTVQLDVPLQVRVLHWSEEQVIAVPTHWPLPSQVSVKEQASPSSQLVALGGETVQVVVPLQLRVLHGSEEEVMAVQSA